MIGSVLASPTSQIPSSNTSHNSNDANATNSSPIDGASPELSAEDQEKVKKLKERDTEVRKHEAAHKAAAGPYAKGGSKFEFERGPDGQSYAVGGEVQIDVSKIADDPEATIKKAQTIKRAANAPADPSSQDQQVAASANKMEVEARRELAEKMSDEFAGYGESGEKGEHEKPNGTVVSLIA